MSNTTDFNTTDFSNEQLEALQLQWELGGIETGKQRYRANFKPRIDPWTGQERKSKSEADLKPGQALIARGVEPVSKAILGWYEHLMSGRANRGAEVAAVFAHIFELPPEWDASPEERASNRRIQALTLAFLALKTAFSNVGETKTTVARALANVVREQYELVLVGRAKDEKKSAETGKSVRLEGFLKYIAAQLNEKASDRHHKFNVLQGVKSTRAPDVQAWSKKDSINLKIGLELLGFVAGGTGWFEVQERLGSRIKNNKPTTVTEHYIELTPDVRSILDQSHEFAALLVPQIKPTLTKPRPWTSVFDGGFYNDHIARRYQFVKLSNPTVLQDVDAQRDEYEQHILADVFEAANRLQETGYRVNERVLSVAQAMWENGGGVGDMPSRHPAQLPDYPVPRDKLEAFKSEQPEAWKKHLSARREVYEYNSHPRRLADKLGLVRTLTLAEELAGFNLPFYFVYTADFRGRFYACSPELNPQGADIHKGLLTFAEGKRMTERAAVWLAIHGANNWDLKAKDDPWMAANYGHDPERSLGKATYDDRYQWVLDHESQIVAAATDPLNNEWWIQAETPFQFLAFCFEWAGWLKQGEGFVSHLPVAADGACNALQWWSGLLLDETTAPKVNLIPTDKPGDIYGDVAVYVKGAIEDLAINGEDAERALAQFWNGRISRGLVKQPVMTKAYGSTALGHRRMMSKKLKDEKKGDDGYKAADKNFQKTALTLLTKLVNDGIRNEVKAAAVGMDWAQTVAAHITSVGIPLNWKTPDGFVVWQGYPETKAEKIETYLSGSVLIPRKTHEETIDPETGEITTKIDTDNLVSAKKGSRVITTMQRETGKLNVSKNRSAVAPNLIHALDGTMMRVVVREFFNRGGTAMMTVHDSYATHAADYELMQQATREVFYTLLSSNILQDWLDQVTAQLMDEEKAKLEAALVKKFGTVLPPMGSLNLEDILESDYLFA